MKRDTMTRILYALAFAVLIAGIAANAIRASNQYTEQQSEDALEAADELIVAAHASATIYSNGVDAADQAHDDAEEAGDECTDPQLLQAGQVLFDQGLDSQNSATAPRDYPAEAQAEIGKAIAALLEAETHHSNGNYDLAVAEALEAKDHAETAALRYTPAIDALAHAITKYRDAESTWELGGPGGGPTPIP